MPTHLGTYRLFFDGACTGKPTGPGGAGFILVDPYDSILYEGSQFLGIDLTHNRARIHALILGLEHIQGLYLQDLRNLEIVSDFKLVIEKLRAGCGIRNIQLATLLDRATILLSAYESSSIIFIPRKYNREANALARRAIEKWRRSPSKG
jgi:ribonuclease H / adenosylcobalamin/alpha-ribazole phosphatase